MNQPFARKLSFRMIGESTKRYADLPSIDQIEALLNEIDLGSVECVTLYGAGDEKLFVLGRPGLYHLTLFIDETDSYAFDDGSGDRSKIDIGGDYWPSFRVCKDHRVLVDSVRQFYWQGKPSASSVWRFFSEDS
jgi:hypothetical protein